MRDRILIGLVCVLAALAIADVATGWAFLPVYMLPVAIAAGIAALALAAGTPHARNLRLVLTGLVAACFIFHLAYAILMGYETRNWNDLAERKAGRALETVRATFGGYLADASRTAATISRRRDLAASLDAGTKLETFAQVTKLASSLRRRVGTGGIAVRDIEGRTVAWAGDLPSYFEEQPQWPPRLALDVKQSSAYYWIEAHAPIRSGAQGGGGSALGWVSVFRAIDARYPRVLPGEFTQTLSDQMARRVGHQVGVVLVGERLQGEARGGGSGALTLPDGTPIGHVVVRPRSIDDERAELKAQGLFVASVLVLALICLAAIYLGRTLLGPRLSKASPRNLALFVGVLWGARLGFAFLRDSLHLGDVRAFTSYDYATQIPLGILRSPADLAITGAVAGVGLITIILARMRFREPRRSGRAPSDSDGLVSLVLGLVAGVLAVGGVLVADLAVRRVLADSSINPFTLSPFDFRASSLVMKAGIFALSVTCLVLSSALVAWEISAFGRFWNRGRPGDAARKATVAAAIVFFVLAGAAAVSGMGAATLVTAAPCFLGGLVIYAARRKKLVPGFVSLIVGFALAASIVQFPHALEDFYSKQKEAIESSASRIMARTDEWKMSILEQALTQAAGDQGVRAALRNPSGRLDSEALRLWAGSILSSARVPCGVHIVDPSNQEVGRFSLEDIGDLAEIESSIRAARFSSGPTTFVSRGTFGGKDADLYVGVAPLSDGAGYLGSIVVLIPYFYSDLESMAGLRPAFFEAMRSEPQREIQFGEGSSASLVLNGRILGTTARDFEVGSEPAPAAELGWVHRKARGRVQASYSIPLDRPGEALILSFRLLSLSERAVYLMGVVLANMIVALAVIILGAVVKAARYVIRRARGMPPARFRWSFATKLALAFLFIAIVPTLILGTTSRGFVRARLREVMESKAEESLTLSRLALERLVGGEAVRLARNPILMDELRVEPSILGVLVSSDVSSAVLDSAGQVLAAFGDPSIPREVLKSVTREGRSYNSFSADGPLVAKAAVPIRDVIFPDKITGCAFVSRIINDGLARRLASDLNRDVTFYGKSRAVASSKQELFVAEIMPLGIASDAYVDCFLRGQELHFTWERVGNVDLVTGYSPLRGFDGKPVGAISVPLVFRKDEVGQRMEWTSTAMSYLLAIVIGSIFVLGLVLARRISDPIRELISGTLRVSRGDLGFTIPKPSDDEIGDLVSSFNTMTAALDKSRNALTERKRYIETIISNVGAGIISTDWHGKVDTFNGAAEELLGIKARNVRGRDAGSILRRIGAGSLASVLDQVSPGEGLVRREVGLEGKGGIVVTLRAVASVVRGPRQRMMGKVIVFEDVTELIRSKKLIAWSEMARQVAHEIKNPLTPMKLSAQHILQARQDGANDFDRILSEGLATIIDEIESLRRIAVEFSQFSRMPERKLETVSINEVAEESLSQYERTIAGSIAITKHLDPSNPRVTADRDELKRVFLNLIENAVQAMPEGGALRVRSRRVTPGVGVDGAEGARPVGGPSYKVRVTSRTGAADRLRHFVEVSFADTGTGISIANSGKLFEPNFSTKTHGMGLGLAISKGTVDAYGGEIVIESAEGVGARVTLRLPLQDKPIRQYHPRRRDSRRKHPPRRG